MNNLFASRSDYRDYCEACVNDMEIPWSFRDWFETYYYYEMMDELPMMAHFIHDCQAAELISSAFTESMGWVECYSSSLSMSFVINLS